MSTEEDNKKNAAYALGVAGGKAGTGDSKRRSPEHYQRMAQIRREQAAKRKQQKGK